MTIEICGIGGSSSFDSAAFGGLWGFFCWVGGDLPALSARRLGDSGEFLPSLGGMDWGMASLRLDFVGENGAKNHG